MDDCARLENVFTSNGNGGSNPFLSARKKLFCLLTEELFLLQLLPKQYQPLISGIIE